MKHRETVKELRANLADAEQERIAKERLVTAIPHCRGCTEAGIREYERRFDAEVRKRVCEILAEQYPQIAEAMRRAAMPRKKKKP
jgi:hypothetical protein